MRNAFWFLVWVSVCGCMQTPNSPPVGVLDAGADAALGLTFDAGPDKPPLGHLAQAQATVSVPAGSASGVRPCNDGGLAGVPTKSDASGRSSGLGPSPATQAGSAGASAPAAFTFEDAGAGDSATSSPPPCAAQDPLIPADSGPSIPSPSHAGEVVITEIMVDPKTVSDTVGEWFELYNATETSLDLRGCTIGDGAKEARIVSESVVLAAHDYIAVARNPQPGFVPDLISSFSLTNTADRIQISCQGVVIDSLAYDKAQGFPIVAGVSMQLDPTSLDAATNDRGSAWCLAKQSYGPELGTPGQPNAPCSLSDASVPTP